MTQVAAPAIQYLKLFSSNSASHFKLFRQGTSIQ